MKLLPFATLALLAMAGCDKQQAPTAGGDVQHGLERSVADVRAAEAAMAAPVARSQSVGELNKEQEEAETKARR